MTFLRISLLEITDFDQQPGWVECEFFDSEGRSVRINDKLPVISDENLCEDSQFPREGSIACSVLTESTSADGRKISQIDLAVPWGLESTSGEQRFTVFSDPLFQKEH